MTLPHIKIFRKGKENGLPVCQRRRLLVALYLSRPVKVLHTLSLLVPFTKTLQQNKKKIFEPDIRFHLLEKKKNTPRRHYSPFMKSGRRLSVIIVDKPGPCSYVWEVLQDFH